MEELISLAQGDGGPIAADTNDGFGLFYLGGEKRMLAMDSKVRVGTTVELLPGTVPLTRENGCTRCHLFEKRVNAHYFVRNEEV